MSLATLLLLQSILKSQQLGVGAPDFIETAQKVTLALAELEKAIAEAQP